MANSVVLTWADDGAAARFRQLRRDLLEHGYITDSEGGALEALVARASLAEVPQPAGEQS